MKMAPSVEVISFTYNESLYLEQLVKWYSVKFSNLRITLFDNHSIDDTVTKAEALGCVVKSWGEKNYMSETELARLKNSCFQDGESEYFLICDVDELLDVDDNDLLQYQPSVVQGIGYNMVGDSETTFEQIHMGVRDTMYDKCLLFKRSDVLEINYKEGAHSSEPKFLPGLEIKENLRRNLYHFRYLSLEFIVERYESRRKRVLEVERLKGFDVQYFQSREKVENEYHQARESSISLPVNWSRKRSSPNSF